MRAGWLAPLALLAGCEQPNVAKNTGDATVMPGTMPGDEATLPPASAPPFAADSGAPVRQPSPAPDPREIPAAYLGEWNMDLSACGTGLHDSRLVIEPTRVRFYESVGKVERVLTGRPEEITVEARMRGEGESWSESYRFALSGADRLAQFGDAGAPTWRYRCPAEPKGVAAHSSGQI